MNEDSDEKEQQPDVCINQLITLANQLILERAQMGIEAFKKEGNFESSYIIF